MMVNKTIIDLGACKGDDSNFYLLKGFDVIAVEANPNLCEEMQKLYKEFIDAKRFKIINRAIHSQNDCKMDFYINSFEEWSSLDDKSKATTGSIIKSKRKWPYKTVQPDSDLLDLTPNDKLILKHLKTAMVMNDRRIKKNSHKDNVDSKLLEKLLIEKSNIEKLIKKTLGNIKNRSHNKRNIR